jgi:hypothetical protein
MIETIPDAIALAIAVMLLLYAVACIWTDKYR